MKSGKDVEASRYRVWLQSAPLKRRCEAREFARGWLREEWVFDHDGGFAGSADPDHRELDPG
jgi:hypothetical protein